MTWTHDYRAARALGCALLTCVLAGCAVAPPRPVTDDPLQGFNRKMFAFNMFADKVAIRPIAKGYTKITGPKGRAHISDFFANVRAPITIVNEVLQGRPGPALESTGRFAVNTTLGLLGFFDPATGMNLPAHPTDFGVTLAHWGVPQGPYLVLPFIGPTTARDVWRLPVDTWFDPMAWYIREHDLKWHAEYAPEALYLVTVRASLLPYDQLLDSAFDPYAFMRDAYLQHRLQQIYYGQPPLSAIERLQGTTPHEQSGQDIDELLKQQEEYEKTHGGQPGTSAPTSGAPAASSSAGTPPKPAATETPAPASSVR